MQAEIKEFKVLEVPLAGKNLIEASAGTGKTYSIAILALRLLLEKEIQIPQILMVTFTNAAVAELDRRIKLFIIDAYQFVSYNKPCDPTIQQIVQLAIEQQSRATIEQKLKDAHLLLDELNIQTIHSFAQQTLQEFAFETKQTLGAELVPNEDEIIEQYLNEFWRKHITNLPLSILAELKIATLRAGLFGLLKKYFEGTSYPLLLNEIQIDAIWPTIKATTNYKETTANLKAKTLEKLIDYIGQDQKGFAAEIRSSKLTPYTKLAATLEKNEDQNAFWNFINDYSDQSKISSIFQACLPDYLISEAHSFFHIGTKEWLSNIIASKAIHEIKQPLSAHQKRANYITYNDIIIRLHKAVMREDNVKLITALQEKYHAVFIDEFQDTDREQYEIFSTLFDNQSIVFFIGDPKQSIYAFRKADIATYFKARNFVNHYYTMDTNYRSSQEYIASMNAFFQPNAEFDAFDYAEEVEQIDYINIKSPVPNNKGTLLHCNTNLACLNITESENESDNFNRIAEDIAAIIHNDSYLIEKNDTKRQIQPNDIGVLVLRKSSGIVIQQLLKQYGIPAVLNHDGKVFEHEVSAWMLQLMQAVITNEFQAIKVVICHPYLAYTLQELKQLDEIALFQIFDTLRETWENSGVAACLIQASKLLGINQKWSIDSVHKSDLSTYHQLVELLHQKAYHQKMQAEDLIIWLQKGINGTLPQDDTFTLRLESDESAVQISTIHSSKGLEYPIVFCATKSITDTYSSQFQTQTYRADDSQYYTNITAQLTDKEKSWLKNQAKKENRRLIYVAITRAVYYCSIYHFPVHNRSNSFDVFITAARESNSPYISFNHEITKENHTPIAANSIPQHQNIRIFQDAYRPVSNWSLLSYSKIALHLDAIKFPRQEKFDTDYDAFLFKELKGGADIGTFLHTLLERIDFSNEASWEERLQLIVAKYFPNPPKQFVYQLSQMMYHITHAIIPTGATNIQLSEIKNAQRLNELEFHFPLNSIQLTGLAAVLKARDYGIIKDMSYDDLEGLMHGFIDLTFEYEGKYYILDWKSNYLGPAVSYYEAEALEDAMYNNGYHTQYLIYTVALHLYLQTRIPDYNYETHFGGACYIFLRGARAHQTSGIYFNRPSLAELDILLGSTSTS